MANIRKLYEADQTTQLMPQTHEKAVVDNNGTTLESKLGIMNEVIQQKQFEVGAVEYDLAPTENSAHWVTSGGLYPIAERTMVETNVPDVKYDIVWEAGSLASDGTNVSSTTAYRTKEILSFDDYVYVSLGDHAGERTIRICYYNESGTFLYYQNLVCDFFIAPNTYFRFTLWSAGDVTDISGNIWFQRMSMMLGGYSQRRNYFKGQFFENMAYINNGDTSSTFSSSVAIPIPEGATSIKVKGTVGNLGNLVCFLDSSLAKITSYNQKSLVDGYRTVDVPATAAYYFVQFGINSTSTMDVKDANDNVIWTPLDNVRELMPVNEAILELRQGDTTVKGFSYDIYEDYMNQIDLSSLVLLHFSDIHANKQNLMRIMNFANKYGAKINDIIHTGDMVASKWDSGVTFWTEVEGTDNILNVIGNHDSSSTGSGNWDAYTAAQCYGRYIEPYVENWGVTMGGEEVCYYYKDYSSIRLIVLDRMHWDSTQESWFTTLLQNSLSKKVIIASHGTPATVAPSDKACNMDSYFKETISPNSGMNSDSIMVEAVDDFIDDGGTFICWLGGHTHWDSFRYISGHQRQVCVLVGTASSTANGNAFHREVGTQSEDNFNIFSVYPTTGTFAIKKIGCSYNRMGLSTSGLVYDYVNHEIIMEY